MPEMEFDQPEDLNQDEEVPVGDPPEEPEPEPEPDQEPSGGEDDRLGPLERAVSELVEWARGQGTAQPARQEAVPARPRPNFGTDTVAGVIWDRLEEIDQKQEARWNKVETERQESTRDQAAFATLVDQTTQYVGSRVLEGDPRLDVEKEVLPIVAQMGLLKDRRIPITRALELAYNAAAFQKAKQVARNQGQQDVRRPDARVPAEYRPRPAGARPQARPQTQQSAAKPNSPEARQSRLKKEMEELESRLGKLSPDELSDALGG